MIQHLERPYTAADFAHTPDDGRRYEIIGGELIVSPSPSTKHQRILRKLLIRMSQFADENDLGEAFPAPLDIRIGDYDIVQPDIVFVRRGGRGKVEEWGIDGVPDLVVEILSPSSRGIDHVRKAALYASRGVQEYRIADPDAETVLLQQDRNGIFETIDRPSEGEVKSTVLPGFTISVADLFTFPEELKD